RVLEGQHPVDRAGTHPEGGSRGDDLRVRRLVAGMSHLDLRAPRLDQPGLVLLAVKLEAERLAGLDEEDLPAVVVGDRPDQLVAPRLLDLHRLDSELGKLPAIWGVQVVAHRGDAVSHTGFSPKCSSAAARPFGAISDRRV